MEKKRKPLSTKKPPKPFDDHKVISEWMENEIMPRMKPIVQKIDSLIRETIPELQYSIKWGSAYYGTKELGWLIELAAYSVSVNIAFISGSKFDPTPPMGAGESRYLKVRALEEMDVPGIIGYLKQSTEIQGWKYL